MCLSHRIICGEASPSFPVGGENASLRMHLYGNEDESKLTLKISDIRTQMCRDVPKRFRDLLDIATYVYAADQAVKRGLSDVETLGSSWRRDLEFLIPVRDCDFWTSEEIQCVLAETVGFLSDDHYSFNFVPLLEDEPFQRLLNFNENGELFGFPEEVVMFSGGLDSLAGAVEEAVVQKRRVVLVNHRSTPKLDRRHSRLQTLLDGKCENNRPTNIRVTVNKKKWMNQEPTQRSRSFLYLAIGGTIAEMLGKSRVRFYENGVISLNLPICAQVVGSKATRTTHPRVIQGFEQLLTRVAGRRFHVENPFQWLTKAEVTDRIVRAGCGELIADSISCTHTWDITKEHSHCGYCSQCIDRRFAVIANGAEEYDPLRQYGIDVFTESRSKRDHLNADKILFANYLERANQVARIESAVQFLKEFPELSRALPYLDGDPGSVVQRCFDLYRRHSEEVNSAVDTMMSVHRQAIRQRTLPPDSLLRIVYESSLPSTASVLGDPSEIKPENIFRRRGLGWEARFLGRKEFTVLPGKGADALHQLLLSQGERISAIEIVCGAAADYCRHVLAIQAASDSGLQSAGNPLLTSLGDISDWKAVRQFRDEAQRLLTEIDRARSENNEAEVLELEGEMTAIVGRINEAVGINGKLKQAKDKRKSIRDGFRNNVNRVIEEIQKTDALLANHIRSSVTFGDFPAYRPLDPVHWELKPILNE